MKLYGLKTCDTTRKALKTLREAGAEVAYIDVRSDGVRESELREFLDVFGGELVNKRSSTWRGLFDSEREADPISLLLANPTLMKRPVIRTKTQIYLGWGKNVQAMLLG